MTVQKVIVDSSVIVKWLSAQDELHLEQADQLLSDCRERRVELYAPEVAKYEVGNALLKGKELTLHAVAGARTTLYALPIHFIPETEPLAEKAYGIAYRSGMTYYDAAFPALASTLRATLVTDNVKHHGKVTNIPVVPLAEYGAHGTRDRT